MMTGLAAATRFEIVGQAMTTDFENTNSLDGTQGGEPGGEGDQGPPGVGRDGTQAGIVGEMQTRQQLYDTLGYHEFERKLDELFKEAGG